MKHITAFGFLLLIVHTTNAVFDTSVVGNMNDLTKILECTVDGVSRFDAPFIASSITAIKLPTITNNQYPEVLRWVSRNPLVLMELAREFQGINTTLQSLFQTEEDLTRDFGPNLQPCNRTGLALDVDDGTYLSSDVLRETVNKSGIPIFTIENANDVISNALLFDAIRCEVVYRWQDLGPTYLPRFVVGGRCLNRNCSFPVGAGQVCHPDFQEMSRLPALRWDCCWELDVASGRQAFDCGWRRVTIPILCDCDCLCLRR